MNTRRARARRGRSNPLKLSGGNVEWEKMKKQSLKNLNY